MISPGLENYDTCMTEFVNNFIGHLAGKYTGVYIIYFIRIHCSNFKNHGMHLSPSDKRLLSHLLMESFSRLDNIHLLPHLPSVLLSTLSHSSASVPKPVSNVTSDHLDTEPIDGLSGDSV